MIIDDTKHPLILELNSLEITDVTSVEEPPAYTEPAYTSTSIPSFPPHNHLRISRDDGSIKGTYVIDPSLPTPPGTGTVKELTAHTKDGSVDLKVYLIGGRNLNRRARIIVGSDDGSVKLSVVERPPYMRTWVAAASLDGNVSVSLPPGFNGLLTITHRKGRATLHPNLVAVTRTFEETAVEYKGWIGPWTGESIDEWEGDECRILAKDGEVKVGFYEPDSDAGTGGLTGFIRQWFK